jgi:hypothetical protein
VIKDQTIDEALIEIMRTKKALVALRKARKGAEINGVKGAWCYVDQLKEHSAAKRASLDLTRKLADLRAGR